MWEIALLRMREFTLGQNKTPCVGHATQGVLFIS